MPSVSPLATEILTCCTALTMPRRVANSTVRSSTSSSGCALVISSSRPSLRVDEIAQSVAKQVEAEHRDHQRDARKERDPPFTGNDIGGAFCDHDSPFRRRRFDAEADKRQPGGVEDGIAHGQRYLHHH